MRWAKKLKCKLLVAQVAIKRHSLGTSALMVLANPGLLALAHIRHLNTDCSARL